MSGRLRSQVAQPCYRPFRNGLADVTAAAFSKTSPTLLRVEAQCRLVLTALRSTVRWLNGNGPQPRVNLFPDHVKDRDRGLMQDLLERWLGQILQLQYQVTSSRALGLQKMTLARTHLS